MVYPLERNMNVQFIEYVNLWFQFTDRVILGVYYPSHSAIKFHVSQKIKWFTFDAKNAFHDVKKMFWCLYMFKWMHQSYPKTRSNFQKKCIPPKIRFLLTPKIDIFFGWRLIFWLNVTTGWNCFEKTTNVWPKSCLD